MYTADKKAMSVKAMSDLKASLQSSRSISPQPLDKMMLIQQQQEAHFT
jgi:hypothetical protein